MTGENRVSQAASVGVEPSVSDHAYCLPTASTMRSGVRASTGYGRCGSVRMRNVTRIAASDRKKRSRSRLALA